MKLGNNLSSVSFDYSKETLAILDALKGPAGQYADESEEEQILHEFLDFLSIADKKCQLEETIGHQLGRERRALEEKLMYAKWYMEIMSLKKKRSILIHTDSNV